MGTKSMTPVTFYRSTQLVDSDTLNQLHEDGVIDRVRFDGRDFYVSADVALGLRNDGIIEMDDHYDAFVKKAGIKKGGGKCGRGWVGIKGSCKRLPKGADRAGAEKAALKEFAAGQRARNESPMARESANARAASKARLRRIENAATTRAAKSRVSREVAKLNKFGNRSAQRSTQETSDMAAKAFKKRDRKASKMKSMFA